MGRVVRSRLETGSSREGSIIDTWAFPSVLAGRERNTLQERVYQELRRVLMVGNLKPGQPVTLRKLAAALGTSPMPVRDAVNRLISERALLMLPNRSVIVPTMTRSRFIELSRTRQMLEGVATEAACAWTTPRLLQTLIAINASLKRCVEERDLQGALAANMEFHFTLYKAGRTKVILPLIEQLWLQAGPFLCLALMMPGVRWQARHHQTTLIALKAGNATKAREAIERDIDEAMQQLLQRATFDDADGDEIDGHSGWFRVTTAAPTSAEKAP